MHYVLNDSNSRECSFHSQQDKSNPNELLTDKKQILN